MSLIQSSCDVVDVPTGELVDRFTRSREVSEHLHRRIPGGAHTYAKGDDQYPEGLAPVLARGNGAHVWDVDGNEFIEYGSGLRSVSLGHAHPQITAAVQRGLEAGSNFSRPSIYEIEAAEAVLSLLPQGDMIKFAKNGSDVTTAAVRLARAYTGRDLVAVCRDQPFFSTDDWFIGTTPMSAGIPKAVQDLTLRFPFGSIDAVTELFSKHPGQIACLMLEGIAVAEPPADYFKRLRALCDEHGSLLILDEMISGFRFANGGAQSLYGIQPDLSTFGKAMGNGFAVAALVGRREVMERGGLRHDQERVFLLSTTHGAEVHALAVATEVARIYTEEPIVERLYELGSMLAAGVGSAAASAGVADHVFLAGNRANLVYVTLDQAGDRSQAFRTLFLQELLRRGILAPSFVVSAALTSRDIADTVQAVHQACVVYRKALDEGVDRYLLGRPVQPVFRPFA